MATETAPRGPGRPRSDGRVVLAKGKPWETTEDAEVLRLRGPVDEKGIRRITYAKSESTMVDNHQLLTMKKLGYEVTDLGEEYEFSMPQKKYQAEVEAKVHADHLARLDTKGRLAEMRGDQQAGLSQELSQFSSEQGLSAEDLLDDE